MTNTHQPVMLREVLDGLAIRPDGCYVDATFGRGGHSAAILERLGDSGRLLALDRDASAVAVAGKKFADEPRFAITHAPFATLASVVRDAGLLGQVDGLLFDFGVSSPQLDDADRGFSFLRDGPLDMRMDAEQTLTAAAYLADIDESALRQDIARLGEERLAARIARAIVHARDKAPITRTLQLAGIVEAATPARVRARSARHPATKTFQAIRMRINDELGQISDALDAVVNVLAIGGRVCFLTFHSLEDRPVKRFLRDQSAEDPVYRGLPDVPPHARPAMRIVGKACVADDRELDDNPRARSARLRVGERLQ
ncbi:MAG: 16S rRNA (cytosine(1402)-N(4))-methyltransferase RsmH [Pseudomonadota bacterium]